MQIHPSVVGTVLFSFLGLYSLCTNGQEPPKVKDQPPQELAAPDQIARLPLAVRGHGVVLSRDGRLRGTATTIDLDTLQLVPTANIDIVFVQNGRIVSQTQSGTDGRFEADGLTPQAVYSVIAKSRLRDAAAALNPTPAERQLYSAFSLAVLAPPAPRAATVENGGSRFISLISQADDQPQDINALQITLIPAQDLNAVGLPQIFPQQPLVGLPPQASTGATGGGGGGATGAALGLGAAAIGAGVAGSGSSSGRPLASPFVP